MTALDKITARQKARRLILSMASTARTAGERAAFAELADNLDADLRKIDSEASGRRTRRLSAKRASE